jgi:DNA-binding protein H-NS
MSNTSMSGNLTNMQPNENHVVGNVQLSTKAPQWLVNLAAVIASVDRAEFLREIDVLTSHVREAERIAAIELAKALVAEYGLLKSDVFAPQKPKREKVTAKYRDPVTGNAWSGRGTIPGWLRGKDLADYAAS